MIGKTHMAVGVAVSLAFLRPKTIQELILGTGISAVGAVISDIDSGTSESHKEANKIIFVSFLAAAAMIAVEYKWHVGIYQMIMRDSSVARVVIAAAVFLVICAYGKEQPHRSFMHSLLALVLLTGCTDIFLPDMIPYFQIAFLSHLVLDFLNLKGLRLFYPLQGRVSLGLCSSRGIMNQWMYRVGLLAAVGMFVLLLLNVWL